MSLNYIGFIRTSLQPGGDVGQGTLGCSWSGNTGKGYTRIQQILAPPIIGFVGKNKQIGWKSSGPKMWKVVEQYDHRLQELMLKRSEHERSFQKSTLPKNLKTNMDIQKLGFGRWFFLLIWVICGVQPLNVVDFGSNFPKPQPFKGQPCVLSTTIQTHLLADEVEVTSMFFHEKHGCINERNYSKLWDYKTSFSNSKVFLVVQTSSSIHPFRNFYILFRNCQRKLSWMYITPNHLTSSKDMGLK